MNTMKMALRFYVSSGEVMTSFRAQFAGSKGLEYTWIVMSETELSRLTRGGCETVVDGYHHMQQFGQLVTFFDFECRNDASGVAPVKYTRVEIPVRFWRILKRLSLRMKRTIGTSTDRVELDVKPTWIARFAGDYGQGRGSVSVDVDERGQDLYQQAIDSAAFRPALDRLRAIAANTTQSRFERATVRLSKDGDGFYFVIVTPKGHRTMYGGLVNRVTEWTIHT